MSRTQRERNVAGAFAVRESRQPAVKDARIVLIDDVMTTGATLTACVRLLLRAGAGRVDALTLARVIRTG
jgi:predicted amidophosphoribosyltransferase